MMKMIYCVCLSFAFFGVAATVCRAEPSSRVDMIAPSVSQAMDESDIDTLKKMIGVLENEIARNKSKNNKTSFLLDAQYGIVCHNMAFYGAKKGNRGFAAKCFELFRTDLSDAAFPDSLKPVVVSYEGSARALMGDEDANPVNKVKFTNEGIAILSGAVDRYGKGSFIPRFMRANVCFSVPDFFDKQKIAKADYQYLEDCYVSGPARPDNGIMAFVFLNQGNFYKKNRDMKKAMEYWKKSISIAPSSGPAKAAAKLIALFNE
jgi:hypothetical protein